MGGDNNLLPNVSMYRFQWKGFSTNDSFFFFNPSTWSHSSMFAECFFFSLFLLFFFLTPLGTLLHQRQHARVIFRSVLLISLTHPWSGSGHLAWLQSEDVHCTFARINTFPSSFVTGVIRHWVITVWRQCNLTQEKCKSHTDKDVLNNKRRWVKLRKEEDKP